MTGLADDAEAAGGASVESADTWKLTAVDALDRDLVEVDIFKAADIDGPDRRIGAWPPEWLDSTIGAEVVLRGACIEGIE